MWMHITIISLQHKKNGVGSSNSVILSFYPSSLLISMNPTFGLEGEIKGSLVESLIFLFYPNSQMGRLSLNKISKVLCMKRNRKVLDKGSLCRKQLLE